MSAEEQFDPDDVAEEGRQPDRVGAEASRRPRHVRLTAYPSALAGGPLPDGDRWPRWLRHALRGFLVLLVLLVVVVGAALAVILSGPTEFAFIRDRVQQVIADGDLVAQIGRAHV